MLADTLNKIAELPQDPDKAEVASLVTESLMARALEGIDGHEPGLILSAQDLVNFRMYELAALALPTSLPDVTNYLGYKEGGGGGLEPADFLATFEMIHNHAEKWNPLKLDIGLVATTLETFGNKMAIWDKACKKLLDDIKIAHVDTPDEEPKTFLELKNSGYNFTADAFPELQLEAHSAEYANSELCTLIKELFDEVAVQLEDAKALEKKIVDYATELNTKIQPAIEGKKTLIVNRQKTNELAPLIEKIDQRAVEIKRLDVAYQAGVKSALKESFIGFGPLAGIYLGIKADQKRKERNALMAIQESDLLKVQAVKTVDSALITVLYRLEQLELLINDAKVSVDHLAMVWQSLEVYIKASDTATKNINDTITLVTFDRRFQAVCAPWKDVVNKSNELLNIFTEAERIIAAKYSK